MYNADEIGLDWRGTLDTLSSVPQSKCAYATADGHLKQYNGKERCEFILEETVADGTAGKLVWAKRRLPGEHYIDFLVKRPEIQTNTKQEAVIQWLCYKALSKHGLSAHSSPVSDIFKQGGHLWFSMVPIYNAPTLDTYLRSLIGWGTPSKENGIYLFKILAQIAACCHILERTIGFNHRDLKPNNILVKTDLIKEHTLDTKGLYIASSPTAILVDFGFSCLGPGKAPWIQAGDTVLPPFDPCPKVGRDIFMLLVFLLWRKDVRDSLIPSHLDYIKSSLHLTGERWSKMMSLRRDPIDWIYMLITERGFQCPALDPWTWLQSCAAAYPEVLTIKI